MIRKKSGETESSKPATPRKRAATKSTGTRAGKKTTASARSVGANPSQAHNEAEVRERAYYIFLARGDMPGDALSDWTQAERELNT